MASEALRGLSSSQSATSLHRGRLIGWIGGVIAVVISFGVFLSTLSIEGLSLIQELTVERTTLINTQLDDASKTEVVVRAGDTLWAIARTHGPRGHDIREIVDWIRELNGLTSGSIYVGQVLMVPIKAPGN